MNPMETRLKADECADFYRSCIAAVSDDAWDRRGHASGFEFSVQAWPGSLQVIRNIILGFCGSGIWDSGTAFEYRRGAESILTDTYDA